MGRQMMDQGELDFLTQQKIELMLTLKTKKLEEELGRMRETLANIQAELGSLRQQVSQRPMPAPAREEAMARDHSHDSPPQRTPAPVQQKPPHPRQGNYTSEDVSIEKYFNFSHKK